MIRKLKADIEFNLKIGCWNYALKLSLCGSLTKFGRICTQVSISRYAYPANLYSCVLRLGEFAWRVSNNDSEGTGMRKIIICAFRNIQNAYKLLV